MSTGGNADGPVGVVDTHLVVVHSRALFPMRTLNAFQD
jgi:hypothetical protein